MPSATGPSSPIVVSDLTNGVAHKSRVRALGVSGAGASPWSAYSAPFTPSGSGSPTSGDLPGNMLRPSYVPASMTRVRAEDFDTGLGQFDLESSGGPGRVTFADSKARVELRPNDYAEGIKKRTEIKEYDVDVAHGVRAFCVWDMEFPSDYLTQSGTRSSDDRHVLHMQLQGPAPNGSYPGNVIGMRTQRGRHEFTLQNYRTSETWRPGELWSEPLQTGVMRRYGLETIFDQVNGVVRLWIDGELVANYSGYTLKDNHRERLGWKGGVYGDVPNTTHLWIGSCQIWK